MTPPQRRVAGATASCSVCVRGNVGMVSSAGTASIATAKSAFEAARGRADQPGRLNQSGLRNTPIAVDDDAANRV